MYDLRCRAGRSVRRNRHEQFIELAGELTGRRSGYRHLAAATLGDAIEQSLRFFIHVQGDDDELFQQLLVGRMQVRSDRGLGIVRAAALSAGTLCVLCALALKAAVAKQLVRRAIGDEHRVTITAIVVLVGARFHRLIVHQVVT